MDAKKISHTHRSTMCTYGLKKLASGVSQEVDKCCQNGDGRNGTKTISPPVTQGDLRLNDDLSAGDPMCQLDFLLINVYTFYDLPY